MLRLFTAAEEHFGFDEHDVWTLFHSYAFDMSVWEIWGALVHGGRLVVVPPDVSRSPEDFLRLLADQKVTVLNQTPSAFRSLVSVAAEDHPLIGELALRVVSFGGERLDIPALRPWVERRGPRRHRHRQPVRHHRDMRAHHVSPRHRGRRGRRDRQPGRRAAARPPGPPARPARRTRARRRARRDPRRRSRRRPHVPGSPRPHR
ncbi:AMP-binding protein [Streptomyces thinghirensis]|nr:AMP-binding protein [Streptomyces thinghirensis]